MQSTRDKEGDRPVRFSAAERANDSGRGSSSVTADTPFVAGVVASVPRVPIQHRRTVVARAASASRGRCEQEARASAMVPVLMLARGQPLAYRACQVLGYNQRLSQENEGSSELIEVEFGRRCFWACWLSTCIVMEPQAYIDSAWKEAAMLPLPGTIASSSRGWRVNHNQVMDKNWHTISVQPKSATTDSRPATAAGSFIKMVGVWAKVQLLCKDRPSAITTGEVKSVHHFSQLATILFHDATSARRSTSQEEHTIEVQNLHIFHDAVYHQCQIVLHSLLVPLFSGIPADRYIDNHRQAQVRAAETVLKHADQFAQLLAPYLSGDEDVSRLPPLVGYGAFVVGMVFLSTDAARRNQVVTETPTNTDQRTDRLLAAKQIVQVLDILRPSWRPVQQPASQPLLRSRDEALSRTRDAPGQTESVGGAHPFTPEAGSNLGEYAMGAGNPAAGSVSDASALNVGLSEVAAVPYTRETDLFTDSEWYGMSLAEVGVEQLVGYEPSSLFLQGWNAFS
ncbi:Fungal transcriptional regulatory protein [Cordyceps fumosorosea ARSEF 2679]|uniref:Fungal transcriptional regulatory protein n=1 Tax=Cordyceps fumosorosea (strain ARSEF 2679) TaxID=1081104 RepID=A0A162JLA6_CORFA|nr:Fungal transcriptional regulatory protein [Cordyceps fumosorosea ARSEF 2679]OAA70632.1 Fungal transcriptional regulatory protein [Cordyceps fumosorosea ARSEF 2679]